MQIVLLIEPAMDSPLRYFPFLSARLCSRLGSTPARHNTSWTCIIINKPSEHTRASERRARFDAVFQADAKNQSTADGFQGISNGQEEEGEEDEEEKEGKGRIKDISNRSRGSNSFWGVIRKRSKGNVISQIPVREVGSGQQLNYLNVIQLRHFAW